MQKSPIKSSSKSKDEVRPRPPNLLDDSATPKDVLNGLSPTDMVNGTTPAELINGSSQPDLVNDSSSPALPNGSTPSHLLIGSVICDSLNGDEDLPLTPKSIEDDESIGLDMAPLTPTTIEPENLTLDTSSQSSDSKCVISDNEITFLIENLAVESDHFEKVSTETVDIASLLPLSESEDNERTPEERSKGEDDDGEEHSSSGSNTSSSMDHENTAEVEAPNKGDESPTSVKWGENKRRQSLMMKYTLKNNLENSAKDLLKNVGIADEKLKNGAPDAYENGSLLAPDSEMNSWASSCANLSPVGPRFKLIKEGDAQVCFLDHTRTVISKILSFKFLRYFESQHLYLNETKISPKHVSFQYIL
ncbi:hypothetical protein V9T40_014274 [Parthenolecanium corni]|uniref:C-Maf-inducing protein PH domain-containing protein n=1 Tax=Parthenolecanium corni TaxID=536013 RepID=A0AAN9THE7_9HEMI